MLPKGTFFNSSMSTFVCVSVSTFARLYKDSVTTEGITSLESMSFELFSTHVANGRRETLPIIEDFNVINKTERGSPQPWSDNADDEPVPDTPPCALSRFSDVSTISGVDQGQVRWFKDWVGKIDSKSYYSSRSSSK